MKKKILLIAILLFASITIEAQIFTQDFESSTAVSAYESANPNIGQFNNIGSGSSATNSIANGALKFERTGRASMFAYRNFDFETDPKFVQLKFDFELNNYQQGTQNPSFTVFIGSNFSTASFGQSSTYASRIGLIGKDNSNQFRISTVDNIGGVGGSNFFSGKQTITFVVNNSGENQTYISPDGGVEFVPNEKMDVWVGTTRVINDFSLKNTALPKAAISGFKFQATSLSGLGIFEFDNIEMLDLLADGITKPNIDLQDTPEEYVTRKFPNIWTSYAERQDIVDNIRQHKWALSLYTQLVSRQETAKNNHTSNPAAILATIPDIPGDRTIYRETLNAAVEAGILYFLTDDDTYAQFASDILHHYVGLLSDKNPSTLQFYQPNFSHLIQCRELFTRVAMIYDFVQPFLSKSETKVYDLDTATNIPFNFNTAQKAFEVMANNVINVGGNNSNHPVLELPGGLYSALAIEDKTVRDNLFDKLLNGAGNSRQPGINWMIDRFSEESLWPESAGYAKFTHALFIQMMNAVDQYKPDLNIVENNKDLLESIFIYENFLYPNGATMAYGDINRDFADHAHIFRTVLKIADRKGYAALKNRAATTLKKIYAKDGGYIPVIETQRLEWNNPLQLLWGINLEDTVSDAGDKIYTTAKATHAGVVMQRNDVATNNIDYGLMYYTGGGTYVHTHATGLDMEIYGAGYVIGPDYGSSNYGSDIHEQYAVSYAAHNTIIVNGASGRGPKLNGNSTWQNIVDPIVLKASEPAVYEDPISSNFSFATQFLDDNINNVNQQRTNSIIRTSPTTGYYVDMYRSFSYASNNFHDYLFHGLGDDLQINSENNPLMLTSTPNRYQNDVGDSRKQPGWRWFSEAKTSGLTDASISARFDIAFDNKYLHVTIPKGVAREYTSALAPPTKAVKNGYDKKDTQLLVLRKYGEAWDKPFIAIYEPSGNSESTIQSAEHLYEEDKIVGVKVVSKVDDILITDYVISNEYNWSTYESVALGIKFTGRFAIVRTKEAADKETATVSMYIGEGQQLTFLDEVLNTDANNKAYLEVVNKTLSTNDNAFNTTSIFAYPNPTTGFFEIKIPEQYQNVSSLIYDVKGKLVSSNHQVSNNNKISLNLSNFAKGIYFVKVNLDKPVFVKVIKK
ncbi:T9SS type A sorting domain-containing protein [uncultured Polaribacter sp.]|uniref:T9SS type A sorting domain-containing protein n=1 Tax=uncultured Polaribacter sp. TaxID=174711 RepID=UPI002615B120|nr:T9SS type A sorting domain-containing protein [uncultured Polaribacter sp.]